MAQEIKLAGLFNQKIISELRIPEIADLRSCLDDGYLPGCNVNSRRLNGMEGYSGHFVVVIGYDEKSLLLHDPGLPARQNLRVSNEAFERAWAYPDSTAKNYFAIRPQS